MFSTFHHPPRTRLMPVPVTIGILSAAPGAVPEPATVASLLGEIGILIGRPRFRRSRRDG